METRTIEIEIGSIRADDRTVEATLSTEHPVRRFDGEEVLSHEPAAVDLSRAPLPLLTSHDGSKLPVGIVENLRLVSGKLKGLLKISANQKEIWNDIRDGILRNLSIGYQIVKKEKTKTGYLATRWMPYECSLVSAGADPSAGIGRTLKKEFKMDYNDILKAKKRAVDEMQELSMTENLSDDEFQKFNDLKNLVRQFDQRIEMMDAVKDGPKFPPEFKPELEKKQNRAMDFEGGPVADRSYKGMFGKSDLTVDEDCLREFRVQLEGTPSAGGFAVPEPLAAKWLDDSLPDEIVRPRGSVWPMTSLTRKVAGWDGADQSAGEYYGGFEMAFAAEGGTFSKQTGKLRSITLSANKAGIFVDASNEVIDDGQGLDAQLNMAIKKSIGLGMDYFFLNGTGAGQPLGITQAGSVVQVSKESGQTADTLCWENIAKMYARMYPAGRSKAVWICNETCIPQLLQMSIGIGTAGAFINVFKEKSKGFSMLGQPVLFSPNMPTLGDENDLMFVDFSQYCIGIRKDIRLERSNIPGWTEDLMSYRCIVRFDGQPQWSAACTPRVGDDLSWCIGLNERA